MLQKPFSIRLFSFCFFFTPVINILLTGWFNHWPLTGPRGVLQHYTDFEKVVLCFYPIVGFGIWSVRRWGYYLFVAFAAVLVCRNFYVLFNHQYYSRYVVMLFQVTTLSVTGLFLQEHVFAPYFDPRARWWESLPRYKFNHLGTIEAGDKYFSVEFIDLSTGGGFFKSDAPLTNGDILKLSFKYGRLTFKTQAKITHVSEKVEDGYSVMFQKQQPLGRIILAYVISQVKKTKKIPKKMTVA